LSGLAHALEQKTVIVKRIASVKSLRDGGMREFLDAAGIEPFCPQFTVRLTVAAPVVEVVLLGDTPF